MSNTIEKTMVVHNGQFHFVENGKYANYYPFKYGFRIKISDKPYANAFCVKREYKSTIIPPIIRKAYQIRSKDMVVVECEGNGVFFVKRRTARKPVPQFSIPTAESENNVNIDACKTVDGIILDNDVIENVITDKFCNVPLLITYHMGKSAYIEFEKNVDMTDYPTFSDAQKAFGRTLVYYPGKEISFVHTFTDAFSVLREWRVRAQENETDFLNEKREIKKLESRCRLIEVSDDKLIVAPPKSVCEFSGETIEPIQQKAITHEICSDCKEHMESGEAGDLLNLVESLKNLLNNIEVINSKLQENERLKAELAEAKAEQAKRMSQIASITEAINSANNSIVDML